MYTNRPGTVGTHIPFDGARHVWTSAAHQRLVEAEQEDAIYHVERPVGLHYGEGYPEGVHVKLVGREGDDWRGSAALVAVADEYEDAISFLTSGEVCPACREQWLEQTGLAGRAHVERALAGAE